MKEMKRILSLFLCLVMLVGYLPVGALATEGDAATDTSALGVVAETTVPETTVPETTVPETTVPETTVPETTVPETTVPETTVPETTVPETTVPETTVPETTVPETTEETEPVKTPVRKPARKPVTNVSKEATGTNTENVLDAAIFFSDLHTTKGNYKTEEIGAVFGQMQETGLKFSSVTSVGDAFSSGYPAYADSTSNVTNVIQGVLGDVPVYYVWSDHDRGADIENFTGLLYGDDSTNYYIYAISMTDMMEGSRFADVKSTFDESKLTAFTETVAELDPSKPLFVVTHVPLHDRRDDNQYADEWYGVISAAAKKMDVAVFWGHNHTQEAAADLNGYYIAKNGSETITIDGVGSVVPNFTYVNAGYMNDSGLNSSATCEYVSTIVKITEDSVIYTLYDEDGVHTCSNHSNATVAREFKDAVRQEPEQPSEPAVTLESIAVTAAPTKTAYVVDETFDAAGLVVTATYSDGTTATVAAEVTAPDMTTAGTKTVTVTFEGKTASFEITVTEPEPSEPEASEPAASEPETSTVQDPENQQITVTAPGATAVTATVLTDAALEAAKAAVSEVLGGNVVAYEIEVAGFVNESGTASVTLPIPEGVTNPAVYHVDGENIEKMPTVKNDDGTLTFTTTHFSSFTVGEDTEITVDDPQNATGSVTEIKQETKTVYALHSTGFDGAGNYLISHTNQQGTANLLSVVNNRIANTTAAVIQETDANGETVIYIEEFDGSAGWYAAPQTSGVKLQNGATYRWLRYDWGLTLGNNSNQASTWHYNNSNDAVFTGARYLRYSSGWTTDTSAQKVYLYKQTDVTFKVPTTTQYTYSIAGSPAEVKRVVVQNDTFALGATLTRTPESGTATTTDVSATAKYEVVTGGDPNGIISGINRNTVTFSGAQGKALVKVSYESEYGTVTNYITLEAAAPYYTLEICEPKTGESGTTYEPIIETVTKKGVEAGNTYTVYPLVKKYDSDNQDGAAVETPKITWEVSNTNIATIATISETDVITFTGKEYGAFNVTAKYLDAEGKLLCEDTITVSVSKNEFVVPEDGTDDFPEYPNQGAVRIDKTAEAVGNFSQTGTAKVELAMTGVPYGANVKTDVVVMVDMTNSMGEDDVDAAEKAVIQLLRTLVYDSENEKYDANMQIYIDTFSSGSSDSAVTVTNFWNGTSIANATDLEAAETAIESFSEKAQTSGSGTRYNVAMKAAWERLTRTGHAENQFMVFVSDGAASAYAPLTNGTLGTTITGGWGTINTDNWFDATGAVNNNFNTEYYSYKMKDAGIPVYTIGVNLNSDDNFGEVQVLNHMSSNYSADGKTATGETGYSFMTTATGVDSTLLEVFKGIGMSIREAATNVVVQDEVGEKYTLTFGVPSGVDAADTGMTEFYIQAVEYTLDETTNQRTGDPTVLEKFTFDQNGALKSHTIKGIACGETCTHVTMSGTTVTAINGTYFQYSTETATNDQDQEYTKEFITWTADKISRTELALQYFAYLDNSAGTGDASAQVEAGTYYTNEEATVTYDNYQGERVQQTFPQPSMTWKGAKVTYLFYLVNEAGQPVNRAGKVIPFAEAIYVTEPVTYDVTWNDMEGAENILARNVLASSGVPDVYELYDTSAAYEIRVYQTEGVDSPANAKNYNYFSIAGSSDKLIDDILDDDDLVDNSTTKVFNTKSGQKYDEYGVYSKQNEGTTLGTTDIDGNPVTVTVDFKADDIDYANTTVAFAVVWDASLVPDTVVMDYGLDVVIDVTTNDALESVVTGVSAAPVNDVEMNSGSYAKSAMGTFANIGAIDGANSNYIGHAMKENNTSVRFRLDYSDGVAGDQGYGMQFKEPVDFYYESLATYYTYEEGVDKPEPHTQYMYSKVTVIPATSIYYEDNFVTFTNSPKASMEAPEADQILTEYGTYGKWTPVGKGVGATQAQDRPGVSKISEKLDADNNYGYDAAYSEMSQYSLGSAMMVKVKENVSGMASFDFYGTGFDVISMTSNTTGTIIVRVYDGEEMVWDGVVDTYYGYQHIDTDGDGELEWVPVSSETANAIYQVPVIKVTGLPYGPKYTAKIVASYIPMLDHTTDAGYEFYMDAVRIYDPTGNKNEVANNAYIADHEAYPVYRELRNNVIAASDFVAGEVNGIVFIDSNGKNMSVANYVSYGPNNELYLAAGQAVAFGLDLTAYEGIVDKVQLGMKSADGTDLKYLLIDTTAINEKMEAAKLKAETDLITANPNATLDEIEKAKDDAANAVFETEWEAAKKAGNAVTLKTSTDMYYDITSLKDKAIIIYNEGAGIMSLTNIKLTFTADPGDVGDLFYVDFDTIQNILDRQNALNKDVTAGPDEETALTGVSVTLPAYVKSGNEIITIYIDVPEGTEIATVSVNGTPTEVSVDEDEGRAYVTVKADTVDGTTTTEKQQNFVIVVTDKEGKTATVNAQTTVYNFQPTIVAVTPTTAKHGEVVTIQVTTSKDVAALEIDGNMLASYRDTDAGRIWTTQKTFTNTTSGNITETVLITAYSETGYDYVYEGYKVQITPKTTTVAQSVRNVVSSIAKALRSLFKNK